MDPRLLLTDLGYGLNSFLAIAIACIVLYRNPRRPLNIAFSMSMFVVTIFFFSHIAGINIADPRLSRFAFMFNVSTLFWVVFTAHWVLILVKRDEAMRWLLRAFYLIAAALALFYITHPDSFLLPSMPLLYFPNYYVRGALYFVGDIFFYIVSLFFLYEFVRGYLAADPPAKNRLRYVMLGLLLSFFVGITPALALYGIDLDPLVAALLGPVGLFTVVYGIITDDPMDIKIIAKRALLYAGFIIVIGIIVGTVSLGDFVLATTYPGFPHWILPLIAAVASVAIGGYIWNRVREADLLRYQFIEVVTHKFRTPLTYITWSVDELKHASSMEQVGTATGTIEAASKKLVELTESLVNTTRVDEAEYRYTFHTVKASDLFHALLADMQRLARVRGIELQIDDRGADAKIYADREKFIYALEILMENGLTYAPKGGHVRFALESETHAVVFSVTDDGIGFSKTDAHLLFNKFYRSHSAVRKETEGIGLGLYLAKNIITQHGGRIWAESAGEGKGSTFTIRMKRA